jgi:hypothetical protein
MTYKNVWLITGAGRGMGVDFAKAALAAQSLYVMNEGTNALDLVFSADERARAVLPYGTGIYMLSTNTSPRATTSSGIADVCCGCSHHSSFLR